VSVKQVIKTVNECVCEWDDCPGKGKPWFSKDERIPKHCHWCHRTTWNGIDLRLKTQGTRWTRVRQCPTCGGTEWTNDAAGKSVCAHCAGTAAPTTAKPKPTGKDAAHAPGCTCTLCRMKRAKKPAATIALPKPKRVRNPE
jgi:hypothetical protein